MELITHNSGTSYTYIEFIEQLITELAGKRKWTQI